MADGNTNNLISVGFGIDFEDFFKQLDELIAKTKQKMSKLKIDSDTNLRGAESQSGSTDASLKAAEQSQKEKEEGSEEKKEKNAARMAIADKGVEFGANSLTKIVKFGFEVIEQIYGLLKKNSPLLQAVESLFNLAVQLFFMPLGNKLGEVLIPAVIKLMDDVTSMWDELGDGGLGEMFGKAIEMGVKMFGQFFNNIGDALEQQGGLIGSIGSLLKSLGNFIEHDAINVINAILGVVKFIVDHLGTMVGLIGTFMSLHYALMIAQMAVTASSAHPILGGVLGTAAAGVAIGGIAGSFAIGSKIGLAEGGYVPATSGGQLRVLGEGGEGEYVIPESKMGMFGSVTNNFYGLTDSELEEKVRRTVNNQIAQSRMRGSF